MPAASGRQPKTACLLIHGFAGSPFEMEPLAPGLAALGCTVENITLPGHDTTIAEFRRTFFPDWLGHAETRLLALAASHDLVIPIGFSMGGSIALTLAARHAQLPQLGGVIALSPAHTVQRYFPPDKRTLWLLLTPLLQYIRPEIPMHANSESRRIAPFRGYENPMCLPQLSSMLKGFAAMRTILPQLTCPLFMMYDVNDRVCRPESALKIARDVSSTDVCLRWVRMKENVTSHHMLTTHHDTRDLVAREVAANAARFIKAKLSAQA